MTCHSEPPQGASGSPNTQSALSSRGSSRGDAPRDDAFNPARHPEPAEGSPNTQSEITIEDFAKVELKIGEVIACEKVIKSEKLLHETVKIGEEVRSVVSGIAKFYTPEEMVGKKVVVVTNLKPVKLCGVLSEGMILCAEDGEGNLSLLTPEKAMASGAKVR